MWEGDRKTWEEESKTWSTRFDQRTKVVDHYFEDNGKLGDKISSLEELLGRNNEDKRKLDDKLSTLREKLAREKEERQREREEYETAARIAEEKSRKWTEVVETLRKEVSILQEALGSEETGREVEKEESATALRTTEEKNEELMEENRSLKDEISTLQGVLLLDKKARQKEADQSAAAVRVADTKSQELAREKKKKDEIIFALETKLKEAQKRRERQLEEKNTSSANRERALGEEISALEVELQRSRVHVEESHETQTRIRELEQELQDLKAQIKDKDKTYSVVLASRNKWKDNYNFRYETFCKEKESDTRAAVERTTASLKSTHENDIREAVTSAVLKVRGERKGEAEKEKEEAISEALSRENLRFSKINAERESIANAEKQRAVSEAVSATEEKARIERERDLQYNQSLQHKQSQINTAYQNLTKSKEEADYSLVTRSRELYNTKSQLSALTEKCHVLEQKLQDSASKTKEHEFAATIERLEADLKEKSAKIISLDAEQGARSLYLEKLRDERTAFLDNLERQKRANSSLTKTLSSREAELETKTSELREFEQKCDSLTEALETQKKENDRLATELFSQKSLLYERGAELNQVSRTNDELTQIVSNQRDATARHYTEMGSQKTLLDETLTKLVRVSGIKDELAQTLGHQKEENARLIAEISSQKSHLDELTAMLNRVSGTEDDLTQTLGHQKEENSRLIVELASQKTQTTRLSSELFTKDALLKKTYERFIEACNTRNKLSSTLECQRKISTAELSSQKALLHETYERLAQVSNTKDELLGQNKQLTGTANHQHAKLSTHIDRIGALTAKVQELEQSNRKLLKSESQLEVQLYDLRHMEPPLSGRELNAIAVKDQALIAIVDLSKTVAELQERLQRFRNEGKGSENGSGHTLGGGSVDMDAQRDQVTSTSEEQPNENVVTGMKFKLCNVRIASVVMEELDQMGENQGENREALPQVTDLKSYRYPVCDCHPELLRDLPEDNVTIMLDECARKCPYCGREAKMAGQVRKHINRSVCHPGRNILLGGRFM